MKVAKINVHSQCASFSTSASGQCFQKLSHHTATIVLCVSFGTSIKFLCGLPLLQLQYQHPFSIISTIPLVHLCSFCALLFKPSQPCLSSSSKLFISSCLSDVHSFPILSSLKLQLCHFQVGLAYFCQGHVSKSYIHKTRLTKL